MVCLLSAGFVLTASACVTMEVDRVKVEDESRLIQLRFDAAVKVIKSLPPDGEWSATGTQASLTSSLQWL